MPVNLHVAAVLLCHFFKVSRILPILNVKIKPTNIHTYIHLKCLLFFSQCHLQGQESIWTENQPERTQMDK